jgi:hypothetical protein
MSGMSGMLIGVAGLHAADAAMPLAAHALHMSPLEIHSGAQTGVDRAALDVARELGLATGGWVPRGRLAEDGTIPAEYSGLRETPSSDYAERTSWNVRDTDATLILFRTSLRGGSAFTRAEAERLGKPVLVVDLNGPRAAGIAAARVWVAAQPGSRLNVAGPRAGENPGIHAQAREWLRAILAP